MITLMKINCCLWNSTIFFCFFLLSDPDELTEKKEICDQNDDKTL